MSTQVAQITLADELRFLGAQCAAHAESTHRDQDRQFVASLVMQLTLLGGDDAGNTAALISTESARCRIDELPDLIRLAGTALRHAARLMERKAARKAVAA